MNKKIPVSVPRIGEADRIMDVLLNREYIEALIECEEKNIERLEERIGICREKIKIFAGLLKGLKEEENGQSKE